MGLGLLGSEKGVINRIDGKILLILYAIYFLYPIIVEIKSIWKPRKETNKNSDKPKFSILISILFVIIGSILLKFGGDIVVDEATELALLFGISERVIGLTIVAIGTALPEMITAVIAVIKDDERISNRKFNRFMHFKFIFNIRNRSNNNTTYIFKRI